MRSTDEARILSNTKVAIIDVKEPSRGSLGAADSHTVAQVVKLVANLGSNCASSAALGELLDGFAPSSVGLKDDWLSGHHLVRLGYAKFGLAGCRKLARWTELWGQAWNRLHPLTRRVAVFYADHGVAESPEWDQILEQAQRFQCRVVLCDTFDKRRGRLLDWVSVDELGQMASQVQTAGMQFALAGSINADDLVDLRFVPADYVAIRSAACPDGREATVSAAAVELFLAAMKNVYTPPTNQCQSM